MRIDLKILNPFAKQNIHNIVGMMFLMAIKIYLGYLGNVKIKIASITIALIIK